MTFKQLFNEYHLNRVHFAKNLGISKAYLSEMLNGNRPMKRSAEMRTLLRNHATGINNFLEKSVDIDSQV